MPETPPTSPRLEALIRRWQTEKSASASLQLADEYRRLERTADAAKVLEEALASNPRHPAAKVALGRCRLELGQTAGAIATLEGVIADDPTQMVAYRLLVEAHIQRGEADAARQRLRIYGLLNDSDPEIAELRRRIGEIASQGPSAAPAAPATTDSDADPDAAPEPGPEPAAAPDPDPTPAAAAPGSGPTAGGGDPFPGLGRSGDGERYTSALASGPFASMWPAEEAPEDQEDQEEPDAAPRTAAPLPEEGARATVTLGRMYLRQGHRGEAEAIFRQVLASEPDNEAARQGLAAVGHAPRAPRRLTAAALLAGHRAESTGGGLTGRKRLMLERYSERLRGSDVR